MANGQKLKIAIVSAFYSDGMGYSENCLSRALAKLGHEVHVVTSTFNVYGNEALYDATYREFLGPPQVAPGLHTVDGCQVHRLPTSLFSGYIRIKGLAGKIREIQPDIVHSLEIGSLQTWEIGALKSFARFKLFTESHQNMSVVRPYMRNPDGKWLQRALYRLTRTFPTWLASHSVELCYAVSPDCAEVAERFYGVPQSKIRILSLGADTDTFHPIEGEEDRVARAELRARLGFGPDDIVCIYTGRFTADKNPLVLAKAIDALSDKDPRYRGLFVGNGAQKAEIDRCRNVVVVPFMNHQQLSEHYRASDVGVWPRQESMSMIDAAASGVPLIVSDQIGEPSRVDGNGLMFAQDSVDSLVSALEALSDGGERSRRGVIGRERMLAGFNWSSFAKIVEADFLSAVAS